MPQRKQQPPQRLTIFAHVVGTVILVAFIAGQIVSLRGGPKIDPEIYALLGIVSGAVFGVTLLGRRNGK